MPKYKATALQKLKPVKQLLSLRVGAHWSRKTITIFPIETRYPLYHSRKGNLKNIYFNLVFQHKEYI